MQQPEALRFAEFSAAVGGTVMTAFGERLSHPDHVLSGGNDAGQRFISSYRAVRSRRRQTLRARTLSASDLVICGPRGIVMSPDMSRALVSDRVGSTEDQLTWEATRNTGHVRAASGTTVPGRHQILISGSSSLVYGHWILDHLPRIELARTHGLLDRNYRVLVSALRPPWADELLRGIGVPDHRVVPLKPRSNVRAPRLSVSESLRAGGLLFGEPTRRAWERTVHRLTRDDRSSVGSERRLFITRARWPVEPDRPMLVNEAAVLAALDGLGFEVIAPEHLSVSEQMRAFQDAELVIGEDGSALHNLIAAPATTGVILLFKRHMLLHASQAEALGHRLVAIGGDLQGRGFAINPIEVRRAVDDLLASRR